MTRKLLLALATTSLFALPMAAQAQGILRGAAEGAEVGADAAGPVGGIVGGAVGAATGTVGGILGVDERPRFRSYVRERGVSSYSWGGPVRVGTVLPEDSVTYYDVPTEYRVRPGYRYTIVNDQPVLVDRGHRIVEVVE
ncbi:DUF1236 domain-containing protein [Methylobacterium sp. NEAU K]|uniref:DUF1236 domain-containing protein n=1 Tax=Methylobacterium sp. NEAU K TaxID=3064946 RepID=UPI0027323529|nr:DUF1236 domain-containing protein [Methylobacterium sp. NEAU K]MDP4006203.1 DUF1236 domain-containing protein [Methylobacterium sp. NEAU K]